MILQPRQRWPVVVCLAMAVALAAVIAVVYAEPFLDGDLFWHMAYARQMIDHGTLRLDHTAFSWTPTSNRMIYCAWASELILNWLWNHVGSWSLFALRYAVILFAGGLMWDFARRLKLADWPLTYFILLVASLAVSAGTLIKPEVFSLLFMNLAVWAFYRGRLAAQQGASPVKWFYLVPVLFVFWVNFHGAHILFAPFLLATAAGEGLNLACCRSAAMSARAYGHLLLAWGLCGLAPLVNPYGVRYPVQLFQDNVLGRTARPDAIWNVAMRSVFEVPGAGLSLLDLGTIMAGLLIGVLLWRTLAAPRKRVAFDFTFLLANLAYVPLFIVYLRSTWFWVPVFAYSFFSAAAQARDESFEEGRPVRFSSTIWRRTLPGAAVVAFVLLAGSALWGTWRHPTSRSWTGFGIGYVNPVPEAEFLAASKIGPRLINLFDSGGYLLWRLWPRYLVMSDQRSFPYLSWFDEQYKFSKGENFDEFLAAHPADAAVIDLERKPVWRKFQKAADWKLAYYGPTAAVFVRDSVAAEQLATDVEPERFAHLKNPEVAFLVFRFACAVADYRTAWLAEEQLRTGLRAQASPEELRITREYRAAHQALRERDYAKASRLFESAIPGMVWSDRDQLIHILLNNLAHPNPEGQGGESGVYEAALDKLAAPP
jgi:hypothetical protein